MVWHRPGKDGTLKRKHNIKDIGWKMVVNDDILTEL